MGQILNFGLPAPIDVQVVGPIKNAPKNYEIAQEISRRLTKIPGAADVHVHQVNDVPLMRMNVDRARASQMGLQQKDVANDMLMSLSSSGTVSPNWWVNPANNVDYLVAVQTPAYKVDSEEALMNTPVHTARGTDAAAGQPGANGARAHGVGGESLQRAAGLRRVRQRAGSRPGQFFEGRCKNRRRHEIETAGGKFSRDARPGGHHATRPLRAWPMAWCSRFCWFTS